VKGLGRDFQFDATTNGCPIKIVSVVDEHTRERLGGPVDRSIAVEDLIDGGYPAVLRCGPELAYAAMADWAGEREAAQALRRTRRESPPQIGVPHERPGRTGGRQVCRSRW